MPEAFPIYFLNHNLCWLFFPHLGETGRLEGQVWEECPFPNWDKALAKSLPWRVGFCNEGSRHISQWLFISSLCQIHYGIGLDLHWWESGGVPRSKRAGAPLRLWSPRVPRSHARPHLTSTNSPILPCKCSTSLWVRQFLLHVNRFWLCLSRWASSMGGSKSHWFLDCQAFSCKDKGANFSCQSWNRKSPLFWMVIPFSPSEFLCPFLSSYLSCLLSGCAISEFFYVTVKDASWKKGGVFTLCLC